MTDHLGLRPHKVVREDRADGAILLRSGYEMSPVDRSTGVWLDRWADAAPTRVFLAERWELSDGGEKVKQNKTKQYKDAKKNLKHFCNMPGKVVVAKVNVDGRTGQQLGGLADDLNLGRMYH